MSNLNITDCHAGENRYNAAMERHGRFNNFAQIIEAWPKQSLLARDLDVSPNLVNVWKLRALDSGAIIPAEYWNALVTAARRRRICGVSLRRLADLAEVAHPIRR